MYSIGSTREINISANNRVTQLKLGTIIVTEERQLIMHLCVAMTTLLVPVVFLSESNIAISDCLRGNSWSYMKQNVHTALALI